jgi:hypothetical protein
VVIDDLDILGARARPPKAHAVLVVDANAVLARPITVQRLEPIPRWYTQVRETRSDFELAEFAARHPFNGGKAWYPLSAGQRCRVRVVERNDQG